MIEWVGRRRRGRREIMRGGIFVVEEEFAKMTNRIWKDLWGNTDRQETESHVPKTSANIPKWTTRRNK